MTAKEFIEKNADIGLKYLITKAKEELANQGHKVSGKLADSLEYVITFTANVITAKILVEEYGIFLDKGVKPPRVPYQRGSGASTSQYIDSLLEWARQIKPSLNDGERKSFVFAVANKHKKEGIPTRGSFVYSSNSRRTGWIKYGLEENEEESIKILRLEEYLNLLVEEFIDDVGSTPF